ncbi:hypothetical protein MYK68_05060 [Gordonia sp. PP30]|uniref:hypothetical protein n=1 Tax=unclassified Gordonia (in: high G+C Gram-positive bacteria) TaxID=2657482 RepID=UPI001FFEDE35|nr:hypothetical protein [Gordonia sp. PP30]UQE75969.1 hypothetical protein MYK68_05060 [Gordonia sp. PP30]
MKTTIRFTNVYDGRVHVHDEEVDLAEPPSDVDDHDLSDWAADEIFPLTGDGKSAGKEAGYFAEVIQCPNRPELVGIEFSWGI